LDVYIATWIDLRNGEKNGEKGENQIELEHLHKLKILQRNAVCMKICK
jgi:hypothetical protein